MAGNEPLLQNRATDKIELRRLLVFFSQPLSKLSSYGPEVFTKARQDINKIWQHVPRDSELVEQFDILDEQMERLIKDTVANKRGFFEMRIGVAKSTLQYFVDTWDTATKEPTADFIEVLKKLKAMYDLPYEEVRAAAIADDKMPFVYPHVPGRRATEDFLEQYKNSPKNTEESKLMKRILDAHADVRNARTSEDVLRARVDTLRKLTDQLLESKTQNRNVEMLAADKNLPADIETLLKKYGGKHKKTRRVKKAGKTRKVRRGGR